jgi:Ca2+-binding RTX toxin-like protein
VELENGGTDLIICTIGVWRLDANVENLILAGQDSLGYGNGLANVISGSAWGDDIRGEGGNDTIIGNGGFDTLSGGAGDDIIQVKDGGRWIDGDDGNDRITTGAGETIVEGDAGDDIIDSNASFWSISGGDGNDVIRGASGDNILWGGRGDDHLSGGSGQDEFMYSPNPNGVDTIADFKSSEGDKLTFRDMLEGTFAYLGSAAFTASGNSEAKFAAGQVLVDTDGNGSADIVINLTGITTASQLNASDFVFS